MRPGGGASHRAGDFKLRPARQAFERELFGTPWPPEETGSRPPRFWTSPTVLYEKMEQYQLK